MRILSDWLPVKAFIGIIYRQEPVLEHVRLELEKAYGKADYCTAPIPFDGTRYYQAEMGAPLWRTFMTFERLIDPSALSALKAFCFRLEEQSSVNSRRQINLDPGYVSLCSVVLSSAKNYSHRVYLGRGVYAEVEFRYENQRFTLLPWTYPDYIEQVEVFHNIRRDYKQQLKEENITPRPSPLLSLSSNF